MKPAALSSKVIFMGSLLGDWLIGHHDSTGYCRKCIQNGIRFPDPGLGNHREVIDADVLINYIIDPPDPKGSEGFETDCLLLAAIVCV